LAGCFFDAAADTPLMLLLITLMAASLPFCHFAFADADISFSLIHSLPFSLIDFGYAAAAAATILLMPFHAAIDIFIAAEIADFHY